MKAIRYMFTDIVSLHMLVLETVKLKCKLDIVKMMTIFNNEHYAEKHENDNDKLSSISKNLRLRNFRVGICIELDFKFITNLFGT